MWIRSRRVAAMTGRACTRDGPGPCRPGCVFFGSAMDTHGWTGRVREAGERMGSRSSGAGLRGTAWSPWGRLRRRRTKEVWWHGGSRSRSSVLFHWGRLLGSRSLWPQGGQGGGGRWEVYVSDHGSTLWPGLRMRPWLIAKVERAHVLMRTMSVHCVMDMLGLREDCACKRPTCEALIEP